MTWLRELVRRIGMLLCPQQFQSDLEEEMRLHLELRQQEQMQSGLTETEAHRAAYRKFGNPTVTREKSYRAWGWVWLEGLLQDTRYALRQLRNAPGFTLTAMLTLALGLGANTAIFTLIHAALLQDLPVSHPEQLVRVGDGPEYQGDWTAFSNEQYELLRKNTTMEFEQLAAMWIFNGPSSFTVRRQGDIAPGQDRLGEFVSGNYFSMLEVAPLLGRMLQPSDDIKGAPLVAVMSYAMWQHDCGMDPSVIGRVYVVNTYPVTIVGVAPKQFYGDRLDAYPTDFFVPLATDPQLSGEDFTDKPQDRWLYLIGRIKPGVAQGPLEEKIRTLLVGSLSTLPAYSGERGREALKKVHIRLSPGNHGIYGVSKDMTNGLHLLMGISGLVLLIACANIANLVLVRGLVRRANVSVRVALGASRLRIMRQMLCESVLLSCLGGMAGIAVAYLSTFALLNLVFPHMRTSPIHAMPSLQVLAFAFGLSMLTGLLFGCAPAWMASQVMPADALRGAGRSTGGQASLLQRSLVVLQAAMSLVLLVGAGLLTKSLMNLQYQNFGMQIEQRVVVHVNPQNAGYTAEQIQLLDDQIHDKMLALPGVTQVGLSLYSPMDGDGWGATVLMQGRPEPGLPSESRASWNRVSPGFFDAIGQHMVRGRNILATDTATSPGVAVVNQAFVKRFFPRGGDPIGQHFGTAEMKSTADREIVGIVEDTRYQGPRQPTLPMFFIPILQRGKSDTKEEYDAELRSLYIGSITLVTKPQTPDLEQQVSQALASINPDLNLVTYETMKDQVGDRLSQEKLLAGLTLIFAVLALTLAAIGLYGVTAYNVTRRTSEIGIRMALGASRGNVMTMVLRGAVLQVGIGLAIGIPTALLCVRLIKTQLYGVTGYDVSVIAAALGALMVSACVAGLIPARRAASTDPMNALRME